MQDRRAQYVLRWLPPARMPSSGKGWIEAALLAWSHLPRAEGYRPGEIVKSGPRLAGRGARSPKRADSGRADTSQALETGRFLRHLV